MDVLLVLSGKFNRQEDEFLWKIFINKQLLTLGNWKFSIGFTSGHGPSKITLADATAKKTTIDRRNIFRIIFASKSSKSTERLLAKYCLI